MGKKIFVVCMINAGGQIVQYNVSTNTLTAAIAAAQAAANVSTDPKSTQELLSGSGVIDLEP